ncbi:MAG: glycoside hydrolase family 130 protein [Candidatus Bathyarchaeia archaeon]
MLYPKKEIVKRYKGNPILTAKDMPYECSGIYNSGVVKFDGKYLMLCRVESIDISNYFIPAISEDGYHFKVRKEPIRLPKDEEFKKYTNQMIYDPRITEIDGVYYVLFAAHSSYGVRIGMLKTTDFEEFEFVDFISEPDNRNGVLFPEKINGLYVRLDRPLLQNDHGDMWVSYSPDLIFWGKSKCVLVHGQHGGWFWKKVGAGVVPIKTKKGWLEIWHGVHVMAGYQYVYHLGVMLLDLNNPSKIVACAKAPILSPREPYERIGLTHNVVFTSGAILEEDGEVKIYYGGADTVQCVATAQLDDLIDACFNR